MQITPPTAPLSIHYHHALLIWLLFYVGECLHILLQLDTIARNTHRTRRAVFYEAWIRILYRAGACTAAFGLIWLYPEFLPKIVGLFGVQIGPDEAAVFALPMNNILALIYGMGIDSLLGYIPGLKSQLPPVELPIEAPLAVAAVAVHRAADAIEDAKSIAQQPPADKNV